MTRSGATSGEPVLGAWVEQLGMELGLGRLPYAERGLCELRLEQEVELTLEAARDRDALLLHAPVAMLPIGQDAEALLFFERLLLENHAATSPEGRALGIDPLAGEAVLWQAVEPAGVPDYEGFVAMVESFVQHAARLKAQLHAPGERLAPPSAAEDPIFFFSHFTRV